MIGKLNATTVIVVLLAINTVAGEYQARNEDEIEVLAAVFSSEISANHWTSSDLICFSIGGMDPSKKLVAELRRRKLNVCSEAEWRRKLACGFSISFNPVNFDSADKARIDFQSGDLREINAGEVHVVSLLRDGEYSLNKSGGKWSIDRYAPKTRLKE